MRGLGTRSHEFVETPLPQDSPLGLPRMIPHHAAMTRTVSMLLISALLSLPVQAQSSRYSTWSNPDQARAAPPPGTGGSGVPARSDRRLQDFVDKLNKLVDEAEKARAANPRFLQDLRNLAIGFDRPWTKAVLIDDFADGDFARDPVWTVTRGTYFIESGWGLRNKVQATQAQAAQPERKLSNEEKALQLFGAILGGKVQQGGGTTSAASSGPQPTDIHSAAPVSNAFALEADLYSVAQPGTFAMTVYQGAQRAAGYRLVYIAGKGIELQRYSSRGTAVVDATRQSVNLEDKKFHRLDWTRAADGTMTVSVDGAEVIKTVDRGFRDPFSGLQLSSRGGDFIVKRVALFGTP